jgi:hypothetical protein
MKPELALELLRRAREEEIGLAVETNNVKALYNRLWEAAKPIEDLMLCIPSTDGFVFIVKKSVELDP